LLTQKIFAFAATQFWKRGGFYQTSHSKRAKEGNFKRPLRFAPFEPSRRRQIGRRANALQVPQKAAIDPFSLLSQLYKAGLQAKLGINQVFLLVAGGDCPQALCCCIFLTAAVQEMTFADKRENRL
jgi:hypothetical protein